MIEEGNGNNCRRQKNTSAKGGPFTERINYADYKKMLHQFLYSIMLFLKKAQQIFTK